MSQTPKIRLSRDRSLGAIEGYKPLVDFIMERGGQAKHFNYGADDPFNYNQGGRAPAWFYSSVTYQDILDHFEFEDGVTLTQTSKTSFVLGDEKLWLTIHFDSLSAYETEKQADKTREGLKARDAAVSAIKLKALRGAIPVTSMPEGRIRIEVKPWKDAREIYYPVIEFAIAHGCKLKSFTEAPDSYFEYDSGGSYVCLMNGNLTGRSVLTEFKFSEDVFISLDIDAPGFALHDKTHAIIIISGPA